MTLPGHPPRPDPERVVRPATVADIAEVVALRADMFRAMGAAGIDDPGWQEAASAWLVRHLDDADVLVAVVEADGRVVATAMGAIRDGVPSPTCPEGRDVLVSNVCTRPAARRQGHGRAAFDLVMAWARGTGVGRAELLSTHEGRAMYEEAGFRVTAQPAMRATL